MILDALRVLLFGMLGIFLVMAIIFGVIVLLSRISAWSAKNADEVVIPIDVDSAGTDENETVEPLTTEDYITQDEYGYNYGEIEGADGDGVEYVEGWSELDPEAGYETVEPGYEMVEVEA